MSRRKMIEVSLPLEEINKQAAREKSIRHGHPSTLHLWWARRPLAAARAVLFSQLVDDPSSYVDEYRAEGEAQGLVGDPLAQYVELRVTTERARLHHLLEQLVDWDNLSDESLFERARAEIRRSCDGNPPAILDPFAGGGTIPLEAQRLGLEAHASDLNPVAVLINKALIEIPPKFAGRSPVFPGSAEGKLGEWPKVTGLAEDVRRYGAWMRDEAQARIGGLYPDATLHDGSKATVIAWIWARTVTCPNPACGIQMPLVRSWWLGKKKGKEAFVVPEVCADRVTFSIGHDPKNAPSRDADGTVDRTGAACLSCGSAVDLKYVRAEGRAHRIGQQLIATVAEGRGRRIYLAPNPEQEQAALLPKPADAPVSDMPRQAPSFRVQAYGMTHHADLFTNRQLIALTTVSDLVGVARELILKDALAAGMTEGGRLEVGGVDAVAYADAVATYLGFGVSKATDYQNALCGWRSDPKNEGIGHLFARQAIPMIWDFCEGNPLSRSSGNLRDQYTWIAKTLDRLPATVPAVVEQADAQIRPQTGLLLATDPPYYDNIGYSDLSDFFYVWLRRSLRDVYPRLLATMLVPKAEELVANPYRHGGKDGAAAFFEDGFEHVFARARQSANFDFPISVYYAFKQSETDRDGTASTGWETLLQGMVRSGWTVTGTWPMRSEMPNRMIASGTNALASSIVLALRPRPESAPVTDRRGFLAALRSELPAKLHELQQGSIAPVDLAQAAIGPGMAVYSRYSRVVEPDGSALTVREALRLINGTLADVLSAQDGDFDTDTRWCVKWFETNGFAKGKYGVAETLASAYNTSVAGLDRSGAIRSRGGEVQLLAPKDLSADYRPELDQHITLWEVVLHIGKALNERGLDEAARILVGAASRIDIDAAKELAYLLFSLAEKHSMTQAAALFNDLGTSWNEVAAAAKNHQASDGSSGQLGLDFDDLTD